MASLVRGCTPKFPFRDREHALAHAHGYLQGVCCGVRIVGAKDLEREAWLEREIPSRRAAGVLDEAAIATIYRWKMSSTIRSDAVLATVLTPAFVAATGHVIAAPDRQSLARVIPALFVPGIRIVAASAFLYWLRPGDLAILDRKATEALDLPSSSDSEYTVEDYLAYSAACLGLAQSNGLSMRDLDRALFVFRTLLTRGKAT